MTKEEEKWNLKYKDEPFCTDCNKQPCIRFSYAARRDVYLDHGKVIGIFEPLSRRALKDVPQYKKCLTHN